MNKSQVALFRNRWQAVQAAEIPPITFEERWQQLNAAYGLAQALQLTVTHDDETQVYLRWAKLKKNTHLLKLA